MLFCGYRQSEIAFSSSPFCSIRAVSRSRLPLGSNPTSYNQSPDVEKVLTLPYLVPAFMHVQILGTRGIPSRHGGFETFAEDLAFYLRDRGHRVTVYCQANPSEVEHEDDWQGVHRVLIPAGTGALGTMSFDWQCVLHSCRHPGIALTLGYNTAIFSILYRLRGHKNVMNMDGLEWKRDKWSFPAKAWLRLNEWLGSRFANHLIADHPAIAQHLYSHTRTEKITVIPYGSHMMFDTDVTLLEQFGLTAGQYYLVIARPEPENSILEIVEGFSARPRDTRLVVLGTYYPEKIAYHDLVLKRAGKDVKFLGPVYERHTVAALRAHARGYVHGHRVGGTNPSLVEAMAAGSPIVAHDNPFTRWVAGGAGLFFSNAAELDTILNQLDANPDARAALSAASRHRAASSFSQSVILSTYEQLLQRFDLRQPAPNPVRALAE